MYFVNDLSITSRLSPISFFNTYFFLSDRPHIITCFSKFFKYVRYFEQRFVPYVSWRTADTHQNVSRRRRILQDDVTSDSEASWVIFDRMIFRFPYFINFSLFLDFLQCDLRYYFCQYVLTYRGWSVMYCDIPNLIALEQYDFHCQMILMVLLHWHSASFTLPDVQPCCMNLFTLLIRLMVFCMILWMIWESFSSVIWALFSCNSVNPLSVLPHLQKIVPNLVLSTP